MDDFDYYLSQPMMDTHMPVPVCLDHNSLDVRASAFDTSLFVLTCFIYSSFILPSPPLTTQNS